MLQALVDIHFDPCSLQLTYSTTRFGIYEVTKQRLSSPNENVPFHTKVLMAAAGGAAGGLVGTPADMINVR